MECPICKGEKCIKMSAIELYEGLMDLFFKYQDPESDVTFKKYPTVGEIGACEETGKKIWYCPYCKKPFPENYKTNEVTIKCPHCDKTLCIPVSNRTFC
ncbi:hypothetical protein [Methanococcus voltae]|uniref:Uncharacterized protein n=2 Tax=Methanococcus voltae TaxID=2188 RepID=A0A8J7S5S0_METVO|nr:hypothetical protein [Methanococcus voltae]MBP2173173.1 hypothetical protein [Methanococcus voltae]MBP2202035.1 hypothetical protein [Methanococcus voltae]MCS3922876.1 hypothetical protein [Methanococcus voltae PS]